MKAAPNSHYLENADYSWSEDSIRFINTASAAARQTFFYVQEAGYFKTVAPYFTERENLHSFLIIYTLKGKGTLRYQGRTCHLAPSSIAYINCMDHHYYACLQNQSWEFLWLHLNGPSALGYFEEFLKNGFRILQAEDPFFMEGHLRRILSVAMRKDLNSEIIISSLIVEVLSALLIQNSNEGQSLGFMPDYLKKALRWMDRHFQDPLTLTETAAQAGVSKYHFSREFKRYIGLTPNEYLIISRLNYAKELLKYSELSIEQIAYSSGFSNVSHFISLFRRHEKYTPLQYRKEWRNG